MSEENGLCNFLGFLGALFICVVSVSFLVAIFGRINPKPIKAGAMFELENKIYKCAEVKP